MTKNDSQLSTCLFICHGVDGWHLALRPLPQWGIWKNSLGLVYPDDLPRAHLCTGGVWDSVRKLTALIICLGSSFPFVAPTSLPNSEGYFSGLGEGGCLVWISGARGPASGFDGLCLLGAVWGQGGLWSMLTSECSVKRTKENSGSGMSPEIWADPYGFLSLAKTWD